MSKKKKAYAVIQEGGATGEVYLNIYDKKKDARKFIKSCDKVSYRTSGIIPLPATLLSNPHHIDALEALVQAAAQFN